MKEQEVFFKNSKGQKLAGLLANPESDKIIIIMSGMRGHKTYYDFINYLTPELNKQGFATLRFDFNSHGESEGNSIEFTRASTRKDFEAALDFVKNKFSKIGVFTTSMSGATLLMHGSKNIYCAVIHNTALLHEQWHFAVKDAKEELDKKGYYLSYAKRDNREFKFGKPLYDECNNKFMKFSEVNCPTRFLFGEIEHATQDMRKKMFDMINTNNKDIKTIKGHRHWRSTPEQDKEIAKYSIDWFKRYLK